jgi:hypothetical protein
VLSDNSRSPLPIMSQGCDANSLGERRHELALTHLHSVSSSRGSPMHRPDLEEQHSDMRWTWWSWQTFRKSTTSSIRKRNSPAHAIEPAALVPQLCTPTHRTSAGRHPRNSARRRLDLRQHASTRTYALYRATSFPIPLTPLHPAFLFWYTGIDVTRCSESKLIGRS